MMKVSLLLGSVRSGRQSHKVAYYLEKLLQKRGIRTDLIDLAEEPLSIHGSQEAQHPMYEERIEANGLRKQMRYFSSHPNTTAVFRVC